ncbi:hypothetical protein BDN72DRAFT_568152 [Pluteus cervinus]|uniref:Uncharacterized protein n=1 Tax=Pluteus cervinus TaxID=181527 RepID=A0ACD3AWQ0_9AGAR|nr:hypothetical protein BDN72DRAFT_568152 [Pluteus cervinus]
MSALIAHAPAVKIGGRRLSLSNKPKTQSPFATLRAKSASPVGAEDYPRPAAPGEEPHQVLHNEDEAPLKKDKKRGQQENEKKLRELSHWKVDTTRPTKDAQSGNRTYGANGRIAQPAGKNFGV